MDWKRKILLQASRLGVADELLLTYDRIKGINGWDFKIDSKIREYSVEPDEVQGDVLLPLTQGQDQAISYSYCVLAHAFKTRGYRPVMPLCHNDLELCLRKENDSNNRSTCAICHSYGQKLLTAFGLDPTPIQEILPDNYKSASIPEDDIHSYSYKSIDVSGFAKATTRRYLKKRMIDYNDPSEFDIYWRLLESAVTLVDCSLALFDENDFKAVIAHHPTYVYGGIYLEVAEKFDVPPVTVQPAYSDQTLHFGNNRNRSPLPQFTDEEYVESTISNPLSDSEQEAIDDLIQSRVKGTGVRIHPVAEAKKSLGVENERTKIGLFTNLMWDASLEADTVVFTSVYGWINTTIEYFAQRSDIELVIKAHPAEELLDTKVGMVNWIRSNYDPLPENVILLEPTTNVSPYELIQEIDLGVVFNSTLGLEMAYQGIPVVVVSDTHYRGLGFTFDPTSVNEYFSLLEQSGEIEMTESMQTRAQRYAHFLFIRKQIDFPFYSQDGTKIKLLPVTHNDVANNEIFDTIIQNAVEGSPIVT